MSAATVTVSPVVSSRARAPGARIRGTMALSPAARVRVSPESGNRTVRLRPATAVTRPGPRPGFKRWVRRSPGFHMRAGLYAVRGGFAWRGSRTKPCVARRSLGDGDEALGTETKAWRWTRSRGDGDEAVGMETKASRT